jgi:hypothetical protein
VEDLKEPEAAADMDQALPLEMMLALKAQARSQSQVFLWDFLKESIQRQQYKKILKQYYAYFAVVGLCPLFIR